MRGKIIACDIGQIQSDIERLKVKAIYHLRAVHEAKRQSDKVHHWREFVFYNDLYMDLRELTRIK